MIPEHPEVLQASDLQVSPSSYVDPNGFVFQHRGGYYRAIYKHATGFYRALFDNGTVDRLVAGHALVPTEMTDIRLDDPAIGMVLKHEAVEPLNYCVEWCPSMLRDAGLALLDLSLAILDQECILQDCYPWNVVFRGTQPVIVDFTSLTKAETPLLWPAYEQFRAFFVRPLQLCSQGKGKAVRALLSNNILGVSAEDLQLFSGTAYRWMHPSAGIEARMDSMLRKHPRWQSGLRKRLAQQHSKPDSGMRKRFLTGLQKKLASFAFGGKNDIWASYYAQMDPSVDRKKKLETVENILRELRPQTVLDLGSNTGVFSAIAASQGCRVVALDSSEACMEQLYANARERKLHITPLLADLYCPTPPGGFMARQYPGLLDRVGSELVLCLGLMHHLHITGRQSLQRIADFSAGLAQKHLVFEYVAAEDDNSVLLTAGRPIQYSLDDVQKELGRHFGRVDCVPSDRPTRMILICSK